MILREVVIVNSGLSPLFEKASCVAISMLSVLFLREQKYLSSTNDLNFLNMESMVYKSCNTVQISNSQCFKSSSYYGQYIRTVSLLLLLSSSSTSKSKFENSEYLTIRPVARKGYGAIAHEAKPNGLLIRSP